MLEEQSKRRLAGRDGGREAGREALRTCGWRIFMKSKYDSNES